jgi:hypothetical protein
MGLKSLVYSPMVDGEFYCNECADSIISRICLFVCLAGWLFGWLVGWLVGCLVGWLVGG